MQNIGYINFLLKLIAFHRFLLILAALIIFVLLFYIRIKFFKLKIDFLNTETFDLRNKLFELNGIIHFHSTYSDGSGSIESLIDIAKELKADFLISSDHNTLKPKLDGLEGYYGNVLYFAGEEINTEFGHFLAVGIEKEIKRGSYEKVLSDIKKQGGVAVICHPHNWWTPWKNFNVEGYNGIEIINLDSQWRGMSPVYILLVILTYKINPFYAMHFLSHKPKKTIIFWDKAQKHKDLKVGIASIDAHSNVKITKKNRIKFPKYAELFSVARTHALLTAKPSGNYIEDKKAIIKALKNGKCYFSYDMFGIPKGFYYEISYGNKLYTSGDSVRFSVSDLHEMDINKMDRNVIIYAGVNINPKKNVFVINLFHNGKMIFSSKNNNLVYKVKHSDLKSICKSGSVADVSCSSFYRVEIDVYFGRKSITYLYSNNIEIYS